MIPFPIFLPVYYYHRAKKLADEMSSTYLILPFCYSDAQGLAN